MSDHKYIIKCFEWWTNSKLFIPLLTSHWSRLLLINHERNVDNVAYFFCDTSFQRYIDEGTHKKKEFTVFYKMSELIKHQMITQYPHSFAICFRFHVMSIYGMFLPTYRLWMNRRGCLDSVSEKRSLTCRLDWFFFFFFVNIKYPVFYRKIIVVDWMFQHFKIYIRYHCFERNIR